MIIKIQEWFFKKFGLIVPVQLLESKKKNNTTKKYFLACNESSHKFELQNNESAKNQYTAWINSDQTGFDVSLSCLSTVSPSIQACLLPRQKEIR